MTRKQGSAVTAVCHDEDCNFLITGDHSRLTLPMLYHPTENLFAAFCHSIHFEFPPTPLILDNISLFLFRNLKLVESEKFPLPVIYYSLFIYQLKAKRMRKTRILTREKKISF